MHRLKLLLNQSWFLPLILIFLSLLVALPILTYPMGRDQGMYANIARSILNGGLPFVDMWDIKPPPIYYIYAAGIAVFGSGSAALRAIDLTFAPFTLIALYWLSLRFTGRKSAAFLTGVLFTVFYFTETFASLTQSDSLVTLPMTLAVLCVVRAGDAPRGSRMALLWALAAGGLSAVTIWFKQYYALFVAVLVLEHLLRRWKSPQSVGTTPALSGGVNFVGTRVGASALEALAFCLGGLPVGLIPLLYFMSNGIWQEMLIVAQGTAQYNAQAAVGIGEFFQQMWGYIVFRWWHWGLLLVLVAIWGLMRLWRRTSLAMSWRLVLLWLVAALAFVTIQAKGFDTHWIPMLPPLALLGGDALDRLLKIRWLHPERFSRFYIILYGAVVCGLFAILAKDTWVRAFPYLTGAEGERAYYEHFQGNDLKPAESLQMIRFLVRNTAPDDTLFIFGFRPEVYYLSGRRPATRFQAQFPLVAEWWRPEWREEAVAALWQKLPAYVLVLQADLMPWVTGKEDDSAWLLAHDDRLQDLEDWLIFNYERQEPIGNFLIWKRK